MSKVATTKSRTIFVGKCGAILEYSSSKRNFSSMARREELGFDPPIDMARHKEKGLVNPFTTSLECKQKLVYLFETLKELLSTKMPMGES